MSQHLTKFATEAEYNSAKSTLTPPNVSYAVDTKKVFYAPEVQPPFSWLWGSNDNNQIAWDNGEVITYKDNE